MLMPKKVKYRKQMRGRRKGKAWRDRKSTRLNSSHSQISYAVFCLKKKKSVDGAPHASTRSARIRLPHLPWLSYPAALAHRRQVCGPADTSFGRSPRLYALVAAPL